MDQSASVFDTGKNNQESLIEQMRLEDSPAPLPPQEQLASESSVHSLHSIEALVDRLVIRMQAIGEEYLERIHSAAAEFMNCVDRTVGPNRFSRRSIHLEIKNAENVFDERIAAAAADMKARHTMLCEEIESVKGRWSGEVFEKIVETEALVLNEDSRIERMIKDPTSAESGGLGRLMRAQAANREMKAYLQGLKFRVREFPEL